MVDKNPTDIIKFRFTMLIKKSTFRKKLKTSQNQLNLAFLHLELTISILKTITLLQNMKRIISTSQFILLIFHHEQSKESTKEQSKALFLARLVSY
jgi:hypothetical protein